MSDFVSLNGQLIMYEDARIAPFDAGFMHGTGLFETMRARQRRVFAFSDHLQRLATSASALAMRVHLDPAVLADCMDELLSAENLSDARIRLSLTGGDMRAMDNQTGDRPPTILISAAPLAGYPASLYERGMTVVVSQYRQNPRQPSTGHKTLSYMDRLLALREAQVAGAGEALWFTAGENSLAEGCISNVFVITADGAICTPPCQYPAEPARRMVLPGITRQTVMKLAAEQALPIQEKMLTIDELLSAREVFLTNAIMGVMPVVRIERHGVADEKPGPLTQKLRGLYEAYFMEHTHGQA